MSILCKYYLEHSIYEKATYYIQKGLELSQWYYNTRWLSQFLLLQINKDLLSSSIIEAATHIDIARILICEKISLNEFDLVTSHQDIIKLNHSIHLNSLRVSYDVKKKNFSNCFKFVENFLKLRASLLSTVESLEPQNKHQMPNLFNELFIESIFILCKALELAKKEDQECKKENQLTILVDILKLLLFDAKSTIIINEKWYLAEYYLLLSDIDPLDTCSHLCRALDLLKANPRPILYRAICLRIFDYIEKTENSKIHKDIEINSLIMPNELNKAVYLMETQYVGLRQEACAVYKQKMRKSEINLEGYNNLINAISFNKKSIIQFYKSSIQTIPEKLTIISLILNNDQLYMIRIEKKLEPCVLKLENFSLNLINKIKKLIEKYNELLSSLSIIDIKKKGEEFLNQRFELNERLKKYLKELDQSFGFARNFMSGSYSHDETISKCQQEINNFYKSFDLNPSNISIKQKSVIYYLFNVVFDGISNEKMAEKHFQEAFVYAQFNNIQSKCFSNYLVNKYIKTPIETKNVEKTHVCLLIDKSLHVIPWESLPMFRNQNITRMILMRFLIAYLQSTNKIKKEQEKAFYIIDPKNDLNISKIGPNIKSTFESRNGWSGIIGKVPDHSVYKMALTENSLFVFVDYSFLFIHFVLVCLHLSYMGHDCDGQYYPKEALKMLHIKACSILMGCSSAQHTTVGEFEPYGTILSYIIGGCPAIVANLWSVTNLCIIHFIDEFLNHCNSKEEKTIDNVKDHNICDYLSKARLACKLSHLEGSVPVIFGLPSIKETSEH